MYMDNTIRCAWSNVDKVTAGSMNIDTVKLILSR